MEQYKNEFQAQITLSLLQSFFFMAASEYEGTTAAVKSSGMKEISRQF